MMQAGPAQLPMAIKPLPRAAMTEMPWPSLSMIGLDRAKSMWWKRP